MMKAYEEQKMLCRSPEVVGIMRKVYEQEMLYRWVTVMMEAYEEQEMLYRWVLL